ncbi:MAG: tetratricopeptide repeat protein, partial [Candidatus Poribacteria bacterium]|nr:tetratricopeptide repeat protein [Candidatus Poribacteria bacterium]
MNEPLKGFITYSHEDTEAKNELRKRLAVMEQQNELVTWDDGQLTPGDGALQEDILKNVADSDLLLYLVSAASLASKNCNRELAKAIKGDKRVIPIILEHCDWLRHQLNDFQALPDRGVPITEWKDKSEGWQNVVDRIREVVDKRQIQADPSSKISEKELHSELAFQHGNLLVMLGQLGMAIEAYSNAINLNPHNANTYNNRGIAYAEKGKLDNAIEDYNITIQLRPDD